MKEFTTARKELVRPHQYSTKLAPQTVDLPGEAKPDMEMFLDFIQKDGLQG